ncbi:Dual specificity tyrosine-phosphorylation-regulated kinase 1A [Gonapodya sp. JEL0774]|nr:Dual specificity tyrosine-phosphorylation-regulated kinase 1A [Gonapodya sp. JEL0774]
MKPSSLFHSRSASSPLVPPSASAISSSEPSHLRNTATSAITSTAGRMSNPSANPPLPRYPSIGGDSASGCEDLTYEGETCEAERMAVDQRTESGGTGYHGPGAEHMGATRGGVGNREDGRKLASGAMLKRLTVGLQDTYGDINLRTYASRPPLVLEGQPPPTSPPVLRHPSSNPSANSTPATVSDTVPTQNPTRSAALATHTSALRHQLASLSKYKTTGQPYPSPAGGAARSRHRAMGDADGLGDGRDRTGVAGVDAQGLYAGRKGEILNERYRIVKRLGEGSFGRVFEALDTTTGDRVAVKVMKTDPQFVSAGKVEVSMLEYIMRKDPGDSHNLVRYHASFSHGPHLCIVYELLHDNLYDYHKRLGLKGLPVGTVRGWAKETVVALKFLGSKDVGVIHCDVKPENILLRRSDHTKIKLADFGSSVLSNNIVSSAIVTLAETSSYIQSRFYRAPEVMLGYYYTSAVDMWSLGCVLVELVTGQPLFASQSELDQLHQFQAVLAPIPSHIFENAPGPRLMGECVRNGSGKLILTMPTTSQYRAIKTLAETFVDLVEKKLISMGIDEREAAVGSNKGWRSWFWNIARKHKQNVRAAHMESLDDNGPNENQQPSKVPANDENRSRGTAAGVGALGGTTLDAETFRNLVTEYAGLFDLVSRMLDYIPEKRIKPADALRHSFLTSWASQATNTTLSARELSGA